MVAGVSKPEQVRDELDALNIEDKVKEALHEMVAIVKAIGRSMEAEHLRMDSQVLNRLAGMNSGGVAPGVHERHGPGEHEAQANPRGNGQGYRLR